MKKRLLRLLLGLALLLLSALAYRLLTPPLPSYTLDSLPKYGGEAAVLLYENLPSFPEEDKTSAAFETYSPLDELGRCGPAYANVGVETMPTGEREAIGSIRPSGWQIAKYDFVDGK